MDGSFCKHVVPSADKLSWCDLPQRVDSTAGYEQLPSAHQQLLKVAKLGSWCCSVALYNSRPHGMGSAWLLKSLFLYMYDLVPSRCVLADAGDDHDNGERTAPEQQVLEGKVLIFSVIFRNGPFINNIEE
eukprot:COSAG02_NODE_627_length_19327_cov_4.448382_4_plen_130_part_00